jgi:hypothetical protein
MGHGQRRDGEPDSLTRARTLSESYAALIRKLEFEKLAARLVERSEVERQQQFVHANIAAYLRALPEKLAPALVGIKSAAVVHTILTREINLALEELVVIAGTLVEDDRQPGTGLDRSLESAS